MLNQMKIEKILYSDANNSYGWAMRDSLPYDEIEFDRNVKLEDILNSAQDSNFGFIIKAKLK